MARISSSSGSFIACRTCCRSRLIPVLQLTLQQLVAVAKFLQPLQLDLLQLEALTDLIAEVAALARQGVREVTLLGQNVNSYGTTNRVVDPPSPYSFADLLTQVSAIEGLQRLRFTTSHPKDLSNRLIDCFALLPNLCPQIHLPVQSGSDRILKRMNRKYTIADYLERVDRLKSIRPDIAITTDIIVGFPRETESGFEHTL